MPVRAAALTAAIALLWCATGCRSQAIPPVVDPAIATSIPPGVLAVGAIDVARLRATPLYPHLPPAARALAETYRDAQRLLAAWNGTDILIAAEGPFREPPPGAMLAAPNRALAGSAAMVAAAVAQRRTGKSGVPALLEYAARSVNGSHAWVVIRGGVTLPLSGNARNLNRLFHDLEYAALSADVSSSVRLKVETLGTNEAAARAFEENLRAFLSLASAGEHGHPETARLLDSVRISRDGLTAHAMLEVPPEQLEKLVGVFGQ
jgi:hypothetical protein